MQREMNEVISSPLLALKTIESYWSEIAPRFSERSLFSVFITPGLIDASSNANCSIYFRPFGRIIFFFFSYPDYVVSSIYATAETLELPKWGKFYFCNIILDDFLGKADEETILWSIVKLLPFCRF